LGCVLIVASYRRSRLGHDLPHTGYVTKWPCGWLGVGTLLILQWGVNFARVDVDERTRPECGFGFNGSGDIAVPDMVWVP